MMRFSPRFSLQWISSILNRLPPEVAHDLAIRALESLPDVFIPRLPEKYFKKMSREVAGLRFKHPIGLAGGFDKDARVFHKLGLLGFSFVEIGSVTPLPQQGNPKPRLFRDRSIGAIVNRYGFNSQGVECVKANLERAGKTCILGVNCGKNKEQTDFASDYALLAGRIGHLGDYLAINLSSPNTPGLRQAQNGENLENIVQTLKQGMDAHSVHKPVFIKLSPDMSPTVEKECIDYLLNQHPFISGLILTNTTVQRPEPYAHRPIMQETGGLSGRPLKHLSCAMLKRVVAQCGKKLAIISCGGIETGADAQERLDLGADLVQIYTSFIFQGAGIIEKMLAHMHV